MTEVIGYEIKKIIPVGNKWDKVLSTVLFRKQACLFEIELTMGTSVGYFYNNLIMLDDYTKAVVLKSDGIKVLVKTIVPKKEVNPIKGVRTIITRKWGGTI